MAVSATGSTRDVSYSCGRCAFKLNLSSSDRLITSIGPRYSKTSRKGILYFLSIDESRFRMLDEVKCGPYFESPGKWGIQRMQTRLLCRQCGATIGHLESGISSSVIGCLDVDRSTDDGKRFCIKIRALQPEQELDGGFQAKDGDQEKAPEVLLAAKDEKALEEAKEGDEEKRFEQRSSEKTKLDQEGKKDEICNQ
ncbi:hypothetical protein SELMODRAFT_441180 [Selaginella moellendorffii]|uniref:Uncharacterized protein n=1 Tax=Selaginella moellendorffii TaxID=88036 RepID=D8RH44_SELML|nr:uncharacterized protein At4g08330, chloroplastic [Selaginella moellendorffii]EFJ28706.1 hypothetical protein SELMODRAFT_441180 [Selaginella moellendorffii]|eukprot:XP_002970576.1 uncharacterized protein At4g08330, chloroplastic [Selaginella moellendorffii]